MTVIHMFITEPLLCSGFYALSFYECRGTSCIAILSLVPVREIDESQFYHIISLMLYICKYKYFGVVYHEHMDFIECANHLADAAGRALGAVISKFRKLKNIIFLTFTKLFNPMIIPVMDYSAGVWGFKYHHKCNCVQTRALSYFFGVHNRAPVIR